MPVTHTFVSAIADDPASAAAGEVLPSHWNASHIINNAPTTLTYAATLAPASSGDIIYRVILTGNLTINLPTGPQDGDRIKFWLVASGADRAVNLNTAIKIPTSSVLTFPVTITSGKKARLMLEYDATLNGGQWEVVTYVMGY